MANRFGNFSLGCNALLLRPLTGALFMFALSGCAGLDKKETFAICKTVDISTTAYALRSDKFMESNSGVAGSFKHGYFPLILFSFALYKMIELYADKNTTIFANVVTCGAAINNSILLIKNR